MNACIAALVIGAALAGCAATPEPRNVTGCGSLPPAFDAPIVCPPVDKTARTVEVNNDAAYGFSIERAPDASGGLRIPPQTVIPFVRPSNEELE
jgi:hypothetical protein